MTERLDGQGPGDKAGDGLFLPLVAINVSSSDGFQLGWCVVDANKRVIGYCMTEKQAHQLADAANGTPRSAGTESMDAQELHAAHALANFQAILRYTEGFYAAAIEHGMKAGETANKVAHMENAARALYKLATSTPRSATGTVIEGELVKDEKRIVPYFPTWQMKEAGGEAYLQSRELEGQRTGLTAMSMAEGIYMTMLRVAPGAPVLRAGRERD